MKLSDEFVTRLQIRNLKRLREKVKEEEEKLRALKSSSSGSAKIKATSSGTVVYKSDCKKLEYVLFFIQYNDLS